MQDYTAAPIAAAQNNSVGQPVRRKEDDALVRGKGRYTDDFNLPGQLYAWMVRSSHAHGVIRGVDTSAAKAMPGVLGVWSGADLTADDYAPFTCAMPLKNRDGSPLLQTNRLPLMTDRVRFVGDPVDDAIRTARNRQGELLQDALNAAGLAGRPRARFEKARHMAYLEPHIEQGGRLEAAGKSIGVVTTIVGLRELRLRGANLRHGLQCGGLSNVDLRTRGRELALRIGDLRAMLRGSCVPNSDDTNARTSAGVAESSSAPRSARNAAS